MFFPVIHQPTILPSGGNVEENLVLGLATSISLMQYEAGQTSSLPNANFGFLNISVGDNDTLLSASNDQSITPAGETVHYDSPSGTAEIRSTTGQLEVYMILEVGSPLTSFEVYGATSVDSATVSTSRWTNSGNGSILSNAKALVLPINEYLTVKRTSGTGTIIVKKIWTIERG